METAEAREDRKMMFALVRLMAKTVGEH